VDAGRQASLVFSFAVRNRDRLKQIIEQERLACDFRPRAGSTLLTPSAKSRQSAKRWLATEHDP